MRFQLSRATGLTSICAALAAAAVLGISPALADESTKAEAAASPATQSAPAASDAAKPADSPVRARGGLTETDLARAFGQYRKQVRKGETLYCRSEKTIGTNIRKQICYSEAQVIQNARNERDARDQLRNTNICGAGSCSPGG